VRYKFYTFTEINKSKEMNKDDLMQITDYSEIKVGDTVHYSEKTKYLPYFKDKISEVKISEIDDTGNIWTQSVVNATPFWTEKTERLCLYCAKDGDDVVFYKIKNKFEISRDSVKIAHKNGANIEYQDYVNKRWYPVDKPSYIVMIKYRIANKTADGLLLEEFFGIVKDDLSNVYKNEHLANSIPAFSNIKDRQGLLKFMIAHPKTIDHFAIRSESKKRRTAILKVAGDFMKETIEAPKPKPTIKPWQVMQAYENGAEIDCRCDGNKKHGERGWMRHANPKWNWDEADYRIANRTADGMLLQDILDGSEDDLSNIEFTSKREVPYNKTVSKKEQMLSYLLYCPSSIKEVIFKRKDPTYRPFTWGEREQLRGKWLKNKEALSEMICTRMYRNHDSVFETTKGTWSFRQIFEQFTFLDGSPCGIKEGGE
jgi:hypothetical protein